MLKNNHKKINIIEMGVILLLAMYYILPSASASYNFMLPIILGFGYVFFTLFNNPLSKEVVKYLFLIIFIAFLYAVLTDSVTISSANYIITRFLSKFYQMFMMFFPIFILERVQNFATRKQKFLLLGIIYAMIAYVFFLTLIELHINPDITRKWGEFAEASQSNIGNYYFVYAIPMIVTVCAMFFFRAKSVYAKIGLAAIIALLFYFLLMAQYTLALIVAFIGVVYQLFLNIHSQRTKIVAAIIAITLSVAIPPILNYAANHVPSENMATRLREVYNFFSSGDSSGYNLSSRMTLYTDSIIAFLKSPFWGNRSLSFDGHATFLTVLADLGLLGGIPFYYLYFHGKKRVCRIIDEYKWFTPVFVIMVAIGFTNPIHAALPLMITTWFIAPLTISLAQPQKGDFDYE